MSAPNFLSVNNSGIYALGDELDDIDIDNIKESILQDLQELGLDAKEIDAASSDSDMNYGGWCFGLVYGISQR